MQTVVIEVSGGVVQQVYANEKLRVIKLDWDTGESPGDAFDIGELVTQPFSTFPPETRRAVQQMAENSKSTFPSTSSTC
jgi:hypothetical protein